MRMVKPATARVIVLIADQRNLEQIGAVMDGVELQYQAFEDEREFLRARTSDTTAIFVVGVDRVDPDVLRRIEAITQLEAPVVVVCPSAQSRDVRALLGAGTAGIVFAQDILATLEPCIRAAQAGLTCVPREHSGQVEPPALSAREKQILALVVMGYSNVQIANQLFVAESTVKSHLSSVFGKLGVRSRNEAIHLILDPDRGLGMGILALGGRPLEAMEAGESN